MVTIGANAQNIKGSFAIQNIQTGKDLRPRDPRYIDNIKLILYEHHNWKCLTWSFNQIDKENYQLKNLYSGNTFQPKSKPISGATLWHLPIQSDSLQYWEFIPQPNNTYLIRQKNTELYLTITSKTNNSDIILMPKQNSDTQLWRLIEQNPTE